ncbi:MAG: T9SS type A sorting domain-containing protein [Flavobacteriales bacterium]|nr:T9SS type A sorting domain-containing protein [Flavobacteriales bacterium]
MKMNKMILTLALGTNLVANAQEFNSVYNSGASYNDEAWAFDVDDEGNMITAGTFFVDTDMDPGPDDYELLSVDYSRDIFVQKLDEEGNFIWAKSFGGADDESVKDIHLAADGAIYVTGHFSGTCDFDPGPGVFDLTAVGFNDGFTVKLDSDGELVWAVSMGGDFGDEAKSVTTDSEGNVYTTGVFVYDTVDFDPGPGISELISSDRAIFIQKLDSDGNFEWAKKLESTIWTTPVEMKFDEVGNFYLCGGFRGECDFDLGAGEAILTEEPGGAGWDGFVLKMNSDFEYQWARQIPGQLESICNDVDIDKDGNVVVLGSYIGDTDLNPGDGELLVTTDTEDWVRHMYLIKLNENGEYVWAKPFEATEFFSPQALAIDHSGNSFITGFFGGEADFDPSAAVESAFNAVGRDGFVLRINKEGDYVFHQHIDSPFFAEGNDIHVDLAGKIYAVGSFNATVDFDPSADVAEETAINKNGYLLILDSECGVTSTISRDGAQLMADTDGLNYQWINCADNSFIEGETNQTFTPAENGDYACIIDNGECHVISDCITMGDVSLLNNLSDGIKLYPNPFNESTTLEFEKGGNGNEIVIIYDLLGNKVYEEDMTSNKLVIEKNNLSTGMYHLMVFDKLTTTSVFSTKLLVE